MNVIDALKARHSTRAFTDRQVNRDTIHSLLDAARSAASGTNTQPWQVAVVQGETRRRLEEAMVATFRGGDLGEMDYNYYPEKFIEPYKSRRFKCGMQLYDAVGVTRDDRAGRDRLWEQNYLGFGAPVVMYFYMHRSMDVGSYLDFGMFLQSLMLAAVDQGLASCPQASLASYPDLVRKELALPDDVNILCGLSLGYEDRDHPINQYRTPREEVDSFTRYYS